MGPDKGGGRVVAKNPKLQKNGEDDVVHNKGNTVMRAHTVAKEWEESSGAGIGGKEAKKVGEDDSFYMMAGNTWNEKNKMTYKEHT